MVRMHFAMLGFFLWTGGVCCSASGELALQPIRSVHDFETAEPVVLLSSGGDFQVNFHGISEGRSAGGRRAFKLDVTFNEKAHCHWAIPLHLPAHGQLAVQGKVYVEQAPPSAYVGVEVTLKIAPTNQAGGHFVAQFEQADLGAWHTVHADVIAITSDPVARHQVVRGVWKAGVENVGFHLEDVHLRLRGQKGDRVVVYLDDFTITGSVPADEAFAAEIRRRWQPCRSALEAKTGRWTAVLDRVRSQLAGADAPTSARGAATRAACRQLLADATGGVRRAEEQGYLQSSAHDRIAETIEILGFALAQLEAASAGEGAGLKGTDCYVTAPTSGIMILPDTWPVPGRLTGMLSVSAARGEYEPASFVLRPHVDLSAVTLAVSDLVSDDATIGADRIDAKIVKCWYQSEGAWTHYTKRGPGKVLVPELLLNDDSLVRVDHEQRSNHLKLTFPDGPRYVWIDDPAPLVPSAGDGMAYFARTTEQFPVRDADVLRPVDIPADRNRQFWLTIHVPEEAAPGIYRGTVKLAARQGALGELELRLRVVPFRLSEPRTFHDPRQRFTSSMYCEAELDPTGIGTIGSGALSEAQFRSVMADLYAHGVTNPIFEQGRKRSSGEARFRKALEIRRSVGMTDPDLYFSAFSTGNPQTAEQIDALQARVRQIIDFVRPFGFTDVHIYGIDEASGERLRSQRPAWQAVREAGAKIFVAGGKGNFEAMGDLLDVMNWSGVPDPAEAAKWHGVGHRIWNYANPQVGVENPQAYRRNFGFLLWKANYDGAATWAYQSSYAQGMWHDFNCGRRTVAMALPTVDGVIDTLAWEGYREGVDDIRYGSTLLLAIERAVSGGEAASARPAKQARRYLEQMDPDDDPHAHRERIIRFLTELHEQSRASRSE